MSESLVKAAEEESTETSEEETTKDIPETPEGDIETTSEETLDPVEEPTGEVSEQEEGYLYAGKYKTVEDFEKGHKELVQKLREKTPEAPEDYSFDFSEDEDLKPHALLLEDLNVKEDPRFEAMDVVFKKHSLTQEAVNDIVKAQLLYDISSMPDMEAEANSLGEEKDIILAHAQTFVNKHLSGDEIEIAVDLGKSAAGVKLLYKMSKLAGEKSIPPDVGSAVAGPSSKELFAEAFALKSDNPRFEVDSIAQARYESVLEAAIRKQDSEQNSVSS